MKIIKDALAGTLESSDVMIRIYSIQRARNSAGARESGEAAVWRGD